MDILDNEFSSGETTQGLIVYENPDGITLEKLKAQLEKAGAKVELK